MSQAGATPTLLDIHLANRAGNHVVAIRESGDVLSWDELWSTVTGVAQGLAKHSAKRWLLAIDTPTEFLIGLLGLLHAGRHPVIPNNFQAASLAELASNCEGTLDAAFLGQCSPASTMETLAPLSAESVIELSTSGSSGAAKPITKTLGQLAAEVSTLETLWGGMLGREPVYATVPHIHIYGLLFRLFWPLVASRPFDGQMASNPHELLHRMQRHGRGCVVSSPAHLSRLPDLMPPEELRPFVSAIFSSGAPLPAASAAALGQGLGHAPLEVYGSTETGGIAWRRQWPEGDTAWQPLPGVDIDFDRDSRLLVRSPFTGSPDFLAVGDLGESLPDGRFRLLGRADRIVKLEGKRVALNAMEQQLAKHPWVKACTIVLVPGRREHLGAVVELDRQGHEALTAEGKRSVVGQLKNHLERDNEPVTLPRLWRFPSAMPYNERGKLPLDALLGLFKEVDHEPT